MKKISNGLYWVQVDANDYNLVRIHHDEEMNIHEFTRLKDNHKGILVNDAEVKGPVFKPLTSKAIDTKNKKGQETLQYIIDKFFTKSDNTKKILKLSLIDEIPDKEISEIMGIKQSGVSRLLNRFKKHSVCQECHRSMPVDYSTISRGYYWFVNHDNQMEPVYIYEENNALYVRTFDMRKNTGMMPYENFSGKIMSKIEVPISKKDRDTQKGMFRAFNRIIQGGKRPQKATCKAVMDLRINNMSINSAAKKHKVSASNVARLNSKLNGEFCSSCGQLK